MIIKLQAQLASALRGRVQLHLPVFELG